MRGGSCITRNCVTVDGRNRTMRARRPQHHRTQALLATTRSQTCLAAFGGRPMKPASLPRTLASTSGTAVARFAAGLQGHRRAPEERVERALSVFADVRAGEGVDHAAADAQRLSAAGRLLGDEAGARRSDSHGGRRRGRLLFGRGAGRPADGRRAALRLARHRVVRIRLIAIVMTFFSATLVWRFMRAASPACAKASPSTSGSG